MNKLCNVLFIKHYLELTLLQIEYIMKSLVHSSPVEPHHGYANFSNQHEFLSNMSLDETENHVTPKIICFCCNVLLGILVFDCVQFVFSQTDGSSELLHFAVQNGNWGIWSTQVTFIPHLISLQLVSVPSFQQSDKRYDTAEGGRGKIDRGEES